MSFIHHRFGYVAQGSVAEVDINVAAFVRLLDDTNFHLYQSRRRYKYFGGHFRTTPARITVPYAGNWHAAVDLNGGSGYVRSTARMLTPR